MRTQPGPEAAPAFSFTESGEAFFLRVFDVSPIPMAVSRLEDGYLIEVNDAFCDETGFAREEVLGRTAIELGLWSDPEDRGDLVGHLRREGAVTDRPMRYRHRSGEIRECLISTRVIEHEGERRLLGAMVTDQASAQEALRRRDAILDAVAFAAQTFLEAPSWKDGIDEVLRRLGEAAAVSRAYIFENRTDGVVRQTMTHEWAAAGVAPCIDDPANQDRSYAEAGLARWEELFRAGEVICTNVVDLPTAERSWLEAQGVASIAMVPLTVGTEWWGYIGFDQCARERSWSTAEMDALTAAARTLEAAIQRLRTESRLKVAEDRYRMLIEQIPAVTYTCAEDAPGSGTYTTTYASPQVEAVLGYSAEDWKNDPEAWRRSIDPRDRDRVVEEEARTNVTGERFSVEYRYITGDGRSIWLKDDSVLVRSEPREPRLWQGVIFDITDLKHAEEQLVAAEAKYRSLVEQIPAITYVDLPDANLTPVYVSPQVESILGISQKAFVSEDLWETHVHPDDREHAVREYLRAVDEGEPFALEYRMLTADGRVVWIHDTASLLRDENGEPTLVQGLMLDITGRKLADEELQRSFDLLRQADADRRRLLERLVTAQEEERKRIAADIHDDSIQKITALGLRLQTLRRHDLGEDGQHMLEQLEGTVQLSIARLRRLMFELRPPALDRDGLAAALRQHLDEFAGETDLATHLENRLVVEPQPATRAIAYRIVQEALTNVRKHASAGNVNVLIESRDGGLFARIRDDGVGFSKAGQASERGHLGLSAMRERAEIAGGWWRMDSAPGAGTTVEFWLPAGITQTVDPAG